MDITASLVYTTGVGTRTRGCRFERLTQRIDRLIQRVDRAHVTRLTSVVLLRMLSPSSR